MPSMPFSIAPVRERGLCPSFSQVLFQIRLPERRTRLPQVLSFLRLS